MGFFVIIVAAGNGTRFNNSNNERILPKQYIKINRKPIIKISVEKFLQNEKIDKIIIVIRPIDEQLIKNIFKKEIKSEKIFITYGGDERINSTTNGLLYIKQKFPNQCKYVMIHDSARPLVTDKIINDSINKIQNSDFDGIFPAIGINDALKNIHNHQIRSVDRNEYLITQTPQTFRFDKILNCITSHNDLKKNPKMTHDEIMFVEQYDCIIGHIHGCKQNIKITTQDDLELVKFF